MVSIRERIVVLQRKVFRYDINGNHIQSGTGDVYKRQELYQSKLLDTNPNFQRKPVWNELRRKSLLIESLMLRIPIPAFYFYEDVYKRQVCGGNC